MQNMRSFTAFFNEPKDALHKKETNNKLNETREIGWKYFKCTERGSSRAAIPNDRPPILTNLNLGMTRILDKPVSALQVSIIFIEFNIGYVRLHRYEQWDSVA